MFIVIDENNYMCSMRLTLESANADIQQCRKINPQGDFRIEKLHSGYGCPFLIKGNTCRVIGRQVIYNETCNDFKKCMAYKSVIKRARPLS